MPQQIAAGNLRRLAKHRPTYTIRRDPPSFTASHRPKILKMSAESHIPGLPAIISAQGAITIVCREIHTAWRFRPTAQASGAGANDALVCANLIRLALSEITTSSTASKCRHDVLFNECVQGTKNKRNSYHDQKHSGRDPLVSGAIDPNQRSTRRSIVPAARTVATSQDIPPRR